MHFIKSVKSTPRIVRLKDDREEKQTDDGRLFHTLTTRYVVQQRNYEHYYIVQRDLYACPLVFVVNLNSKWYGIVQFNVPLDTV